MKILIVALLLTVTTICFSQDYIIPNADNNEQTPSPPSLDGTILKILPHKLVIKISDGKSKNSKSITVKLNKKSELFTCYGGYVDPTELVVGQKVRVWYTEKNPKSKPPIVAAMMLASIDPKDDWPQ